MQIESSNWNNPAKEVAQTIGPDANIIYGGMCCDVWVYSWVMMVQEVPDWLKKLGKDMEGVFTQDSEGPTPKLIADQFLCIMKSRGMDLGAYMVTGEALLDSPDFEYGIADNYESVEQFVKADKRIKQDLRELLQGKSDAFLKRD